MDLDTLLRNIREVLHGAANVPPNMKGRVEIRIDIEVLDHIEWHLSNHRRQNGNLSRPPPRDPGPRTKREREERYDSAYEYMRQRRRRDYEEYREYSQAAAEAAWRAMNEEIKRRAEEARRAYQGSYYGGFNQARGGAGFEEIFGRNFYGDFGKEQRKDESHKTKKEEPKKRPWYEVLGVRETVTKPEAQKAYRRLCMRFHPDRKPEGDKDKMSEINVAWKESPFGR